MRIIPVTSNLTRSLKYASLGCVCITLACVIIITNPLDCIIKDQLSMRDGSLLFYLFKQPPLEVFINVYAFNITNAAEFIAGIDLKLNLSEVGPYVYQEFLEHSNSTFHPNGTLSYYPHRRIEFIREKSIGDPNTDILNVLNLPLLGASTVAAELSFFAAIAMGTLANTLKSEPILNITVQDYLWGYDDPLVKMASNFLPGFIHFEKFGILDRMFDEGTNQVTIQLPNHDKEKKLEPPIESEIVYDTKETEHNDLFSISIEHSVTEPIQTNASIISKDYSIQYYNGKQGFSQWGYDESDLSKNSVCNTLKGAFDGTIFPQNMSTNEEFRIYRKVFCRTLPIRFDRAGRLDGVDAYYFELADNAFESDVDDPKSSCYCLDGKCLKKGLGNITPCYYSIPTAVSYPHFYRSDPSLLNDTNGLAPNSTLHGSEVVIQPQLGVPMRVHSRIQLNILTGTTKFNYKVKKFDNLVIPIIWVDLNVEHLTKPLIVLLHLLFNILPYVQIAVTYLLGICGMSLFSITVLSQFFVPNGNQGFNPKKDIKYSAIQMFPIIKRGVKHMERCIDNEDEMDGLTDNKGFIDIV